MKTSSLTMRNLFLMTFAIVLLSSCTSNSSEEHGSYADNDLATAIGRYVTCPTDSVEMMLNASDSIIFLVDTCSLELLGLDNEEVNNDLISVYRNEIPAIVKLYGTYDAVTNFPTSEANAAFARHEIANALIAEHYGKENS